jgi:hypothetical protein
LYNVINKVTHTFLIWTGKVKIMEVSYKRLWKLLIDKDMKKKDLVKVAHISTYTINKLNRGDNVNTDTLVKICSALHCSIEDIMEVIPDSGEQ